MAECLFPEMNLRGNYKPLFGRRSLTSICSGEGIKVRARKTKVCARQEARSSQQELQIHDEKDYLQNFNKEQN